MILRLLCRGKDDGYCTGCSNTDSDAPTNGFQVTIKATVKENGDGTTDTVSGAPLLENIQVLDYSVGCDAEGGETDLKPVCLPTVANDEIVDEVTDDTDEPATNDEIVDEVTDDTDEPATSDDTDMMNSSSIMDIVSVVWGMVCVIGYSILH